MANCKCLLCGNSNTELFTEIERVQEITRYECGICGVFFFERLPDKLPVYDFHYNMFFRRPGDIQKAGIMAKILGEMARELSESPKILEIGPGNGLTTFLLHQMGIEVDCCEPDPRLCEHILEQTGVKPMVGAFENLKLKRKYDLIYAGHVIEHVPNPLFFVEKAKDSLLENGILFMDTPDTLYFRRNGVEWKHLRTRGDFEHLFLFEKQSVSELLHRAGLKLAGIRSLEEFESMQVLAQRRG